MERRPGVPDRVFVAEALADFNWTASPACRTLNSLFPNHEFGFKELVHLVRTFLEVMRKTTTITGQNSAIGREPLRRKSIIQKWIHEHWDEMQDFCSQLAIEIPIEPGRVDVIGPRRSEFLDRRQPLLIA
jgi:hypothetical protein